MRRLSISKVRSVWFVRVLMALITYHMSLITITAETINGYVLLNGQQIPAEYTKLGDGTVGLGTGRNACISQYTSGRVMVPSEIVIENKVLGIVTSKDKYKVTQIMDMAFRLCDNITLVDVSEGVKRIGNFAFIGCHRMQELDLPSTLEKVGTGAFIGLENLNYLSCKATTPPQWEYNDVFFFHKDGIGDTEVKTNRQGVFLQVPPEVVEAYKSSKFTNTAIGWKTPEGWGTAFCNFNGSALEDYRVYDVQDLEDVRRIANNRAKFGEIKRLWIEADVEMNDTIWPTPIGNDPKAPFTAEVYGQGHTLSEVKVENGDVAALIGYYAGPKISGVRLKSCYFHGDRVAAGIVASTGAATIEKCYADADLRSDGLMGGIVGEATAPTIIDRCVGQNVLWSSTDNAKPTKGGLAGRLAGATVTNCAVLNSFSSDGGKAGIFVAEATGGSSVSIDYSYSMNRYLTQLPADGNIRHGDHIILYGQKVSILNYGGAKTDLSYVDGPMQSPYAASVLGIKAWAYTMGQYPMPDCFVDRWPVRANYAVYGSESIYGKADNLLVPDEEIVPEDWRDLSPQGFRKYKFKTSRILIDEKLDVEFNGDHLPLGLSEQIVSRNGVIHDQVLRADYMGKEDVILPIYQTDEEGNLMRDDDDKPIKIGEKKADERDVWQEHGYAISLPYPVNFGSNATLYQPTRVYDVSGQPTVLFETVRDNRAEPFRPYYLVVKRDSVTLGTEATVTMPLRDDEVQQLANYTFIGSMSVSHEQARRRNTYTLDTQGRWSRQTPADNIHARIAPYSSYFMAIDEKPKNNELAMELSDGNPLISEGDFYFRLNSSDDGKYTATLTGYHGRGRNTVVPGTVATAIGGLEQHVPVTDLGPNIFTECTAQIWSIDMSECSQLTPVTVDRTKEGNPFYRVDERTIIYLPEGKAQPGKNVVAGTECQHLTITDRWDFHAPYAFHADVAEYSRTLYAKKKADGKYEPYAYSICLPFEINEKDIVETFDREGVLVSFNTLEYVNTEGGKRAFVFVPSLGDFINDKGSVVYKAGKPYLITIDGGSYTFRSEDTKVVALPDIDEEVNVFPYHWDLDDDAPYLGLWNGTFTRIDNDEAAERNSFTLNSGKWQRIRSDEDKYRNAYIETFRAFFEAGKLITYNSYTTDRVLEPRGDGDPDNPDTQTIYQDFPASQFAVDTDFSGYDDTDDPAGIVLHTIDYEGNSRYFDIHGRLLHEKPRQGLYINNGKIMFAK